MVRTTNASCILAFICAHVALAGCSGVDRSSDGPVGVDRAQAIEATADPTHDNWTNYVCTDKGWNTWKSAPLLRLCLSIDSGKLHFKLFKIDESGNVELFEQTGKAVLRGQSLDDLLADRRTEEKEITIRGTTQYPDQRYLDWPFPEIELSSDPRYYDVRFMTSYVGGEATVGAIVVRNHWWPWP